ncbi:hypothetical protein G5I_03053 [Acromyrmex echinatior]|uniref:Uncharacterized protein n=1 Tax=Acromyrmex echinatior TaxID=103372 RepID=F4WBY2_ACREC|nr:hypothetical protein G5I_03053 [Acromyrmex echinatior]
MKSLSQRSRGKTVLRRFSGKGTDAMRLGVSGQESYMTTKQYKENGIINCRLLQTLLQIIQYSLNLNQWIITDISAKYATGNQWLRSAEKAALQPLMQRLCANHHTPIFSDFCESSRSTAPPIQCRNSIAHITSSLSNYLASTPKSVKKSQSAQHLKYQLNQLFPTVPAADRTRHFSVDGANLPNDQPLEQLGSAD